MTPPPAILDGTSWENVNSTFLKLNNITSIVTLHPLSLSMLPCFIFIYLFIPTHHHKTHQKNKVLKITEKGPK